MPNQEQKIELVTVKVNGQEVPVKGFVQDFIGLSILGMLKSLKDVPEPKDADIHIRFKSE